MRVQETFLSVQGTGHLLGVAQYFLRLAGCSVADCYLRDACDEPAALTTEGSTQVAPSELVEQALEHVGPHGWLHITGGEPMDQAGELEVLVRLAQSEGLKVHLQTSGTRPVGMPFDWITVSPKTEGRLAQPFGHEIVYVVREWTTRLEMDLHGLKRDTSFWYYYLSPEWGTDASEVERLVQRMNHADRHENLHHNGNQFMLTLQAHKYWGVK